MNSPPLGPSLVRFNPHYSPILLVMIFPPFPQTPTPTQVCDFPMIMVTLERASLTLPSQVKFCLDTLAVMRKSYKVSFSWDKASDEDWTIFTETGQRSLCVEAVATWIASEGGSNPTKSFVSECGDAHDALADAKGGALMVMPGEYGIYNVVMRYKVLEPISLYIDKAKDVLTQPVIVHLPPHPGWTESANPPAGEVPMPMFARGLDRIAGNPTDELLSHIKELNNGEIPTDPEILIYAIFTFYFTMALLVHIANCTNAYAKLHGPNDWYDLTAFELMVHLGIRILMGIHQRANDRHYWCRGIPGLRLDAIADICTERRHRTVIAMLTFDWRQVGSCCLDCPVCNSQTGYEEFIDESDPLAKIRDVDTYLLMRTQRALHREHKFVVDETVVKVCSKYCPFGMFNPMKPIKFGVKYWCLVFCLSHYLYNWRPSLGKRDPVGKMATALGKGYVHTLIYDHLIPIAWHHSSCVLICDNYFTSIPLFTALLLVGIYAIGVCKLTRPAKSPKEQGTSWPIQEYGKQDEPYLPRGWMRVMYRLLDGGKTMMAMTWRDNRFVKLLATCCIVCASALMVQRWDKLQRAYIMIPVCAAMLAYQELMNGVDRMDAVGALANIRMKKCPRRFQRQLFFYFYLNHLGHGNVKILFSKIHVAFDTLKKKHDNSNVGFFWWFQNALGQALIRRGLEGGRKAIAAKLAAEAAVEAAVG